MTQLVSGLVVDGSLIAQHTKDRAQPVSDAASVVINVDTGDLHRVVLAGNRTVAAPTGNPTAEQVLILNVVQDAVGGRTLAWNAIFLQAWSDTGNTAGKQCFVSFRFNGTNWVQMGQGPYV